MKYVAYLTHAVSASSQPVVVTVAVVAAVAAAVTAAPAVVSCRVVGICVQFPDERFFENSNLYAGTCR